MDMMGLGVFLLGNYRVVFRELYIAGIIDPLPGTIILSSALVALWVPQAVKSHNQCYRVGKSMF